MRKLVDNETNINLQNSLKNSRVKRNYPLIQMQIKGVSRINCYSFHKINFALFATASGGITTRQKGNLCNFAETFFLRPDLNLFSPLKLPGKQINKLHAF